MSKKQAKKWHLEPPLILSIELFFCFLAQGILFVFPSKPGSCFHGARRWDDEQEPYQNPAAPGHPAPRARRPLPVRTRLLPAAALGAHGHSVPTALTPAAAIQDSPRAGWRRRPRPPHLSRRPLRLPHGLPPRSRLPLRYPRRHPPRQEYARDRQGSRLVHPANLPQEPPGRAPLRAAARPWPPWQVLQAFSRQ
uniref:Uncharacterized protein n=1 Tax=Arundo donax TaxID=35708 RepID=A0A0A9CP02_ARUDO